MEIPPEQRPQTSLYTPERTRANHTKPAFGKWILILLALAILIGGGFWFRSRVAPKTKATAQGGRGGASFGPVPVLAGNAVTKDVPIYLDGLGTVQAFNTVTVRPRVDGQILKIGFVEGQDVRAGDLLAQIDPAPFQTQLDQNVAKKAQDEAQLSAAQTTLQRDATLLKDKILSQQDYDTQKATVDQLAAAVQADEAAINNAKVQLNYTTINAPLDGRTGIRQVDAGNIVHAAGDSNAIVVITQLRPITVVFTLPEQDMKEIQQQLVEGQELSALAMGRDNRTLLDKGKLSVIDNQIDTATGTLRLKATFPNPNLSLWPGQFVNIRLLVTTRKDGIVVPASVVQRGPDGPYAFVIKPDSSVEVRPIQVGHIEQNDALIDSGLKAGEQVVVDGQYKLKPGSRVKISSPATGNKPGGERGLGGQSHQTGQDRPARSSTGASAGP